MADTPVLGTPTGLTTHPDGRFTVEFTWATPPDVMWLRAAKDMMSRSGRESIEATPEGLSLTCYPEDTDSALADLDVLMTDTDRHYKNDLEHRQAAIDHVQSALQARFGNPELPVREG
jgi:hypothetical protein